MNYIGENFSPIKTWIENSNVPLVLWSNDNPMTLVLGSFGIVMIFKGLVNLKNGQTNKKLIAKEICAGSASLAFAAYRIYSLKQSLSPKIDEESISTTYSFESPSKAYSFFCFHS